VRPTPRTEAINRCGTLFIDISVRIGIVDDLPSSSIQFLSTIIIIITILIIIVIIVVIGSVIEKRQKQEKEKKKISVNWKREQLTVNNRI
jgi:ammonia channel protein AmtB